ncbi:hypothetical protein EDWATA_03914 [Edwardsiella tarda ATCC 23685]|uniref:Uncharacterized protein n=1 Tax=Edwardsiella tarda ATCC 23685 TaxID=500638 RepID=D4FAU3_EDWTA|nr:hypothetical protein EDWATA_03914 [Edwardsiella tarda ATCC 23685]
MARPGPHPGVRLSRPQVSSTHRVMGADAMVISPSLLTPAPG